MVTGSKFRWMSRFSTRFEDSAGRTSELSKWAPKLTWLEYELEGESAPRSVVTIDITSIRTLLDAHGFGRDIEEDGTEAIALVRRLADLCGRSFHLTDRNGTLALGISATPLDEELDDRIAKSEKDVRRLAPQKGAYWVRDANLGGDAEPAELAWMLVILYGNREWEFVIPRDGFGNDECMVGLEIVGPIPDPA